MSYRTYRKVTVEVLLLLKCQSHLPSESSDAKGGDDPEVGQLQVPEFLVNAEKCLEMENYKIETKKKLLRNHLAFFLGL